MPCSAGAWALPRITHGKVDLQLICMFQKLVLARAHEAFVAASESSQDPEEHGNAAYVPSSAKSPRTRTQHDSTARRRQHARQHKMNLSEAPTSSTGSPESESRECG